MTDPSTARPAQLVVVGSSAGGIEALSTLVSTLPDDFPAPIVIAQHLDPKRFSHLKEILGRRSTLPVRTVEGKELLEPGVIFVVPANRHVQVSDHQIALVQDDTQRHKPSIDLLLNSASAIYGEDLIAVILTGTGSDGAAGARNVKQRGGTVIIQNPATASYPALPQSLAPNTVDIVADIEDVGPILNDLVSGSRDTMPPDENKALQRVITQLRERQGIDFNNYKTATILRRLQRRMAATGKKKLSDYVRFLQTHPEEYQRLVNSFLIKVTEFFRDPEVYQYLRDQVLPGLIEDARARNEELRIWSAGCATGEEAYSLAILIAETQGDRAEELNARIFATDLDGEAIAFARRGVYSSSTLAHLDPDLVTRYFHEVNGEFEVSKRVRSLTVFGEHDLADRAPFPRIDLLVCRNVLIYFTTELQRRALQLFGFSLRDGGWLVLGKAETTTPMAEYFVPDENRLKIYRRRGDRMVLPPGNVLTRSSSIAARLTASSPVSGSPGRNRAPAPSGLSQREKSSSILHHLPVGVVCVDRRYDIQFINDAARQMLGIPNPAVGDDFVHLADSLPSAPLRSALDRGFQGESTVLDQIETHDAATDSLHFLRIACYPEQVDAEDRAIDTVVVVLTDVTEAVDSRQTMQQASDVQQKDNQRLTEHVQRLAESNRSLLLGNQELTATTMQLRSENEELLVGHEEMLATSEEAETLNEELQSTNEELETLNEELQSTVEELNTTNDDLQARSEELQALAESVEKQRHASEVERARLQAVLDSMGDAVVVVDHNGSLSHSNSAYDQLFGPQGSALDARDEQGRPMPPEDTPQARGARGESFTMQFTLTQSGGSRRWFEAGGQSVRTGSKHDSSVIVIRDITDRSLRRLQDEFLAMASHELRTPLTVLSGYISLLSRSSGEGWRDEQERVYLDKAAAHVRRLEALFKDLLDATRLQSGKLILNLDTIDLETVVENVVEMGQVLAPERVIRQEITDHGLQVQADERRVEQAILSLLTNALVHAEESERIDVRLLSSGGMAEIQVQDYGPGIAVEKLTDLFSRFHTAGQLSHASRDGLGLGLYIARELVRAHGGSIESHSELGKGSTFTIKLPLVNRADRERQGHAAM